MPQTSSLIFPSLFPSKSSQSPINSTASPIVPVVALVDLQRVLRHQDCGQFIQSGFIFAFIALALGLFAIIYLADVTKNEAMKKCIVVKDKTLAEVPEN